MKAPANSRRSAIALLALLAAGPVAAGDNSPVFYEDLNFSDDDLIVSAWSVDRLGAGDVKLHGMRTALQPDGKLVTLSWGTSSGPSAGAELVVHRHNADGSLDTSFDTDGARALARTGDQYSRALFVQPGGKIVVGSTGNDGNILVQRLNSDGSDDASFGSGGVLAVTSAGAGVLAIDADGALWLADFIDSNGIDTSTIKVWRTSADGVLDASFGTAGVVTLDLPLVLTTDSVVGMQASRSGGVWIWGRHIPGDSVWDGYVLRLTATGALDSTVVGDDTGLVQPVDGSGGLLSVSDTGVDFDSNGADSDIVVTGAVEAPEGGLYLALETISRDPSRLYVWRLAHIDASGQLVTTFDFDGIASCGPSVELSYPTLSPTGDLWVYGLSSGTRAHFDPAQDSACVASSGTAMDPVQAASIAQAPGLHYVGGYVWVDGSLVPSYTGLNYVTVAVKKQNMDTTPELTPAVGVTFAAVADVATGAVVTGAAEITGLEAGATVPVRVSGGEIGVSVAEATAPTSWSAGTLWVGNGDWLHVRHTAAATASTDTTTTLTIGGMAPANNLAQTIGDTTTLSFTSTTAAASGGGGGGGGSFGAAGLLLAVPLLARLRRRRAA